MINNTQITDHIKRLFQKNWKKVFLYDGIGGETLSYEDFFSAALYYRYKLEHYGLKKGDILGILLPNSLELVLLYFASLLLELVVVPIDPAKGSDEIKEILACVNCRSIVSSSGNCSLVHDTIEIEELRNDFSSNKREIDALAVWDSINYNSLFLITFTSGSSGIPKGVKHSFRNLYLSAQAFIMRFGFNNQNVFYHNLPMTYMAGILNLIILPFFSESKIVLGERFTIANIMRFWELPIRYSANTFWLIPTIISLLLKLDRGSKGRGYATDHPLTVCVGTAPLHKRLKKAFEEKYQTPLYESYGLSETLLTTTNAPGLSRESGVGKALEWVKLDFGKDKEILVSVPWMFLGYTNEETDDFFTHGKYRTGDLGEIDKSGFLSIIGRKKELIIKGGINISPGKIEKFIDEVGFFEESAILGFEDITLGEKIVCFYIPKEIPFVDEQHKKLNNQLIEKYGKEYCIDLFVRVENIPMNMNGKVDKVKIKETFMNHLPQG